MTVDFIPAHPSNYYAGRGGNAVQYIVVHYTANDGDTDTGNARYFQGANRQASAHYFVDEDSVTQSVRDTDAAWHCGGGLESSHHPLRGICTNRNSIGVELCSDKRDGRFVLTDETVKRGAALVRELMQRYNIPAYRVVRHYDVTGKACPEPFVRDVDAWANFKKLLTEEADEMTAEQVREIIRAELSKIESERRALPASGWAQSAWSAATTEGVTDGTAPQATMTREQCVTMLQRLGLVGR